MGKGQNGTKQGGEKGLNIGPGPLVRANLLKVSLMIGVASFFTAVGQRQGRQARKKSKGEDEAGRLWSQASN